MPLSKQHYDAIAAIIDSARSEFGPEPAITDIANELASYFKRDNPRFSKDRFMEACGL